MGLCWSKALQNTGATVVIIKIIIINNKSKNSLAKQMALILQVGCLLNTSCALTGIAIFHKFIQMFPVST